MVRSSEDCLATYLLAVILLKLPVKSSFHFKSVEKTWFHYFQNINFIFQHLSISKKNKLILVYYRIEFRILSVCNEKIPPNLYISQRAFGFGLDSLSNDYKVIQIKSLDDGNKKHHGHHYAVYKMSTDIWRVLKHEDLQRPKYLLIMNNNSEVCINGFNYWHGDEYILAFYFGTKTFQFFQLPYPYLYGKLIPLQNCLSLWNCERTPKNNRINQVWILTEDHCWNKLLKIEHILEVNSMLGFWKNSNVLVVSTTGQLLLYNLETKEFRETEIKSRCYWDLLQVYSFEENLVGGRRN
ncbi:hypothetical protein V6Z11_A04G068300 [Gossypium hirsutum]